MVDVLYLKVTNKEWFELSLKTIKRYLLNYGNIYILQTNEDLSQFKDVIVVNQSIFQFMKRKDITQKIIIIEQDVCLLTNINPVNLPITYIIKDGKYIQDHIKPQIVQKSKFLELPIKQYQYPLSQYFKHIDRIGLPDTSFTIIVDKPICCTKKSLLQIKNFAIFNSRSFSSMKKYIQKKLNSLI